MSKNAEKNTSIMPWKLYVLVTLKSVVAFYLATFSVAVFFTHQGWDFPVFAILQIAMYVFVIALIVKNLVDKFSVAALMLIVPIAPLLAMIIIVTMLPILEWLV